MKTALLILGLLAAPALVGYYIQKNHPVPKRSQPVGDPRYQNRANQYPNPMAGPRR
jgi:hypothetical protein